MRVETKKVTIEQEVYIAKDGKEFFSEDSCEQYEMELNLKSLKMWDRHFEETNDLDTCYYVRLATKEDIRDMISACKWSCITIKGIEDVGTYIWVDEQWINLDEVCKKLGGMGV